MYPISMRPAVSIFSTYSRYPAGNRSEGRLSHGHNIHECRLTSSAAGEDSRVDRDMTLQYPSERTLLFRRWRTEVLRGEAGW